MKMLKSIAIVTPGGDAPGMNACVRAVTKYGLSFGLKIYGIQRGYAGLLENDFVEMKSNSVSGIIHHGGTILKSNRCKEIRTEEGIKKAVQILKQRKIDYLIVIGGDGSLSAGLRIAKKGISVIGIPASIDNDVYGTDETIGFDTALDTAVEAVDKIRDTATSFERIFVIEVMGREHGFLALDIAAASGAEVVVIPEVKIDFDRVVKKILFSNKKGKSSMIIIFAEGAGDSKLFAKKIESATGLEVRVSTLGYIQRGGEPTGRSRILALKMAVFAINLILKNKKNVFVAIKNNKIMSQPLWCLKNRKEIDLKYKKIIESIN